MPTEPISLVVGLGNPGREYEDTRHNAGFWWIDQLANRVNSAFKAESKFSGLVGKAPAFWLLKPTTFMNRSGQAVGALAKFYRIDAAAILVVHDELDLPAGEAKLKLGGSHGGHNGLKDIDAHLGTRDYWRLRIGIGHPRALAKSEGGAHIEVVDYVLQRPGTADSRAIEDAMHASIDIWETMAVGNFEAAMLKLHTKPAAAKPPKTPKTPKIEASAIVDSVASPLNTESLIKKATP
jgi:peptidyl-tRNA hydrolase, PTH1 family